MRILDIAEKFFEACEAGKGWKGCAEYCTDKASFSAEAVALEEINSLEGYADWMCGTLTLAPWAQYYGWPAREFTTIPVTLVYRVTNGLVRILR